jgi:senataxin
VLLVQYRMHPDISRFPSTTFYDGAVEDGPHVQQPSYGSYIPQLHGSATASSRGDALAQLPQHQRQARLLHYSFVDVKGQEARDPNSSSWYNSLEAGVVVQLAGWLNKQLDKLQRSNGGSGTDGGGGGGGGSSIPSKLTLGIITPYSAQVRGQPPAAGLQQP